MEILAKTYFAGKNYFCQSGFYHGKAVFSTVWQKPANPDLKYLVLANCADTLCHLHFNSLINHIPGGEILAVRFLAVICG